MTLVEGNYEDAEYNITEYDSIEVMREYLENKRKNIRSNPNS